MAIWTAKELTTALQQGGADPARVFLVTGERYLCRRALTELEKALLADGGTVHAIDGEEEDPRQTIARLRSFSLLPGRQIFRVTDTRLFHSKNISRNLWQQAVRAREQGNDKNAARRLAAMLAAAGLDPADPDANPARLSAAAWKKTFGFPHPGGDLSWCGELLATLDRDRKPGPANGGDPAELLIQALEQGIPESNILILVASEVDRRKKLFRYLKKHQVIIDLGVEQGSSKKARTAQKTVLQDLVRQTLAEMGKTMAGGVLEPLLERVGFHPVAVVMETEKLCLSVGERKEITREDLEAVVGRTRQEALFELTGAVGERQCGRALALSQRLVNNGIHPLAIVATLRNQVRSLLLFRALQEQEETGFHPAMQAGVFQNQCLVRLRERESWRDELSGHPYAVYMQFKTAARFDLDTLTRWMRLLLAAERRLKSSSLEPLTVLHHLLVAMLVTPER